MSDVLGAAVAFVQSGISVIPIRADGSKAPAVKEWKSYQEEIADFDKVIEWFGDGGGLAVVCGAVSGGLEMAEVEGRAIRRLGEVEAIALESGMADLWAKVTTGYAEQSPSGGIHWLYRVEWNDVRCPEGNKRVARQADAEKPSGIGSVLAETRGEGGYVVVAPTDATYHKDGRGWTMLAGSVETIPTLTPFERDKFLHLLAELDECETAKLSEKRERNVSINSAELDPSRPGDDFELKHTWAELLRDGIAELSYPALGWEVVDVLSGGNADDDDEPRMWVHPDASNSQSASTGYHSDRNRLYVFTSSTLFEQEKPYNKFGVYALVMHEGDFAEAARTLGLAGYGDQTDREDSWAELLGTAVGEPPLSPQRAAERANEGGTADSATSVTSPASSSVPSGATPPAQTASAVPAVAAKPEGGPWTDMGLAARVARQEGHSLRFVADLDRWHVWNGRVWGADETGEHKRRTMKVIRELVPYEGSLYDSENKGPKGDKPTQLDRFQTWALQCQGDARIRAAINIASATEGIAVTRTHFDSNLNLMSFANGTLELDSQLLRSHDPLDHVTRMLDYAYVDNSPAPTWEAFIERVLPDPDDRAFMQRAVGYSLTGQNNRRAMFILIGPAATGKSKFLDGLSYAFGDYGITASAGTLMAKRNESDGPNPGLRAFEGPRLIVISETNRTQAWDEAIVKRVTGGDAITTRALYSENVTFRPTGIMWMATNAKPTVTGDDGAIYTRMMLMPFKEEIPLEEQDAHLNDKLRAERAGIMAWAIEGLRMYLRDGLKPSANSMAELENYKNEQDSVVGFLDEATEAADVTTTFASVKRLYAGYLAYCQAENYPPFGRKRFTARLDAMPYVKSKVTERGQAPVSGFESNGPTPGYWGIKVTGDLKANSKESW